jgi:hypothetical protein
VLLFNDCKGSGRAVLVWLIRSLLQGSALTSLKNYGSLTWRRRHRLFPVRASCSFVCVVSPAGTAQVRCPGRKGAVVVCPSTPALSNQPMLYFCTGDSPRIDEIGLDLPQKGMRTSRPPASSCACSRCVLSAVTRLVPSGDLWPMNWWSSVWSPVCQVVVAISLDSAVNQYSSARKGVAAVTSSS